MARSRNIKPGFFTNDRLAECEPLARILFAGLWCIADREGRLEDRPKRIKAELLPYDATDAEDLLRQLVEQGFLFRYKSDGHRYIQVLNFDKHQNPHIKESPSAIPAPDEHGTSTVQEQCEHEECIEQATLIPDSLILIPDSLQKKSPRFAPLSYLTDAGVDEHVAQDWITLRKQKKAAVTATAIKGVEREATKAGCSLQTALETCCQRGWAGFKADWLQGQNGSHDKDAKRQNWIDEVTGRKRNGYTIDATT
jgi:hypothetical protein